MAPMVEEPGHTGSVPIVTFGGKDLYDPLSWGDSRGHAPYGRIIMDMA